MWYAAYQHMLQAVHNDATFLGSLELVLSYPRRRTSSPLKVHGEERIRVSAEHSTVRKCPHMIQGFKYLAR